MVALLSWADDLASRPHGARAPPLPRGMLIAPFRQGFSDLCCSRRRRRHASVEENRRGIFVDLTRATVHRPNMKSGLRATSAGRLSSRSPSSAPRRSDAARPPPEPQNGREHIDAPVGEPARWGAGPRREPRRSRRDGGAAADAAAGRRARWTPEPTVRSAPVVTVSSFGCFARQAATAALQRERRAGHHRRRTRPSARPVRLN